ncbi:rhomboid family intramembrane serine protease [Nocardia cyriacigeorgica]|uniref:Rhomboid family intramembrane serine protease n=1 Tax=Nocardia cyriacigeorgica TaxID=135487 RepID=A0A6P1DA85_9NOCA|nr:rhomboid family intramembrane serine protease [Nocardia cyriacigeorgica]NEW38357.1 rhomboid family intramembrane serine protease [Nocardia cyriacigeorgica]NEW47625.1 rhomboid family intramembrane serine protease [Nocardia cyriacigeorgica]NEW49300.1 rhomboid family intramembrane serine protease [Nocardia cyriacigeorgica]NEW54211.1 rhomboid family intramembrane serine protease [Nocardia cyriacigeorgica]
MNPQPPATTCVRHPDRATGLSCTRCGRPACPECLRPASVGQHCVDCLRSDQRSTPQVRTVSTAAAPRVTIPYVTYALIAVNVAVFAVTAAQSRSLIDNYNGSSLFLRWVMFPPAVADGDWVRVIGSGFLHYGPLHLLLNMFALYVVGRDIELVLGRLRYLAVYLVSLLGGSAAVMVFAQDSLTAGASGAVYGLFGAITVILIRLRQNANSMLILIGINVFISFSLPGISLFGHLGGLAAGTLGALGILFLPTWLRAGSTRNAQIIGWSALAAITVISLAVIGGAAASLLP